MKKLDFLTSLAAVLMFVAFSLFSLPKSSDAQGGSKQWISTTCQVEGGGSWPCNDCTFGENTCNDNTCLQCRNPGMGE